MKKIYDVLIIGGGPAGYSAALYASRAGLSVAVTEKLSIGGQMTLTDVIDNYPGFEEGIDGITLGEKMQRGAERYGAETIYGEVLSVSLEGDIKSAITDAGEILARAVVIATGAYPRELGIPGERERLGRGVHYCAHCDGRFYRGRRVAVIGGGNSAAQDAVYLSRIAERVTLLHRRKALRAEMINERALRSTDNVDLMLGYTAQRILFDERGVVGIEIKSTETGEVEKLLCDAVFVSIGRVPATELFRNSVSVDKDGYVIADETTSTSVPGVFAAGDVRAKPFRQVVTAVADGAVAAHYAETYLSEQEARDKNN